MGDEGKKYRTGKETEVEKKTKNWNNHATVYLF
jgi:hypothetical protein